MAWAQANAGRRALRSKLGIMMSSPKPLAPVTERSPWICTWVKAGQSLEMIKETPPLVAGWLKTQLVPLGGAGVGMSVTCCVLVTERELELNVQIGWSGSQ